MILQKLTKKERVPLEPRLRTIHLQMVIVIEIQSWSVAADANCCGVANNRDSDRSLRLWLYGLILPALYGRESHNIVDVLFIFVV